MKRGQTITELKKHRGDVCHYCPNPATTVDHVVPKARGGTGHWWNLVGACTKCNQKKADQLSSCPCPFCQAALGRTSLLSQPLNGVIMPGWEMFSTNQKIVHI